MHDFDYYINSIGEFGFAEEILNSIVYASGLPTVRPNELVVFENGEMGRVISLRQDHVEVLVLSNIEIRVGTRMARTNQFLTINLADNILGRMIDPIGNPLDDGGLWTTPQLLRSPLTSPPLL